MLKHVVSLEHKIGDRVFSLFCDQQSPIVEVKEALNQFLGYIIQVENASKTKAEAPPEDPTQPVEPVPPEPPQE